MTRAGVANMWCNSLLILWPSRVHRSPITISKKQKTKNQLTERLLLETFRKCDCSLKQSLSPSPICSKISLFVKECPSSCFWFCVRGVLRPMVGLREGGEMGPSASHRSLSLYLWAHHSGAVNHIVLLGLHHLPIFHPEEFKMLRPLKSLTCFSLNSPAWYIWGS